MEEQDGGWCHLEKQEPWSGTAALGTGLATMAVSLLSGRICELGRGSKLRVGVGAGVGVMPSTPAQQRTSHLTSRSGRIRACCALRRSGNIPTTVVWPPTVRTNAILLYHHRLGPLLLGLMACSALGSNAWQSHHGILLARDDSPYPHVHPLWRWRTPQHEGCHGLAPGPHASPHLTSHVVLTAERMPHTTRSTPIADCSAEGLCLAGLPSHHSASVSRVPIRRLVVALSPIQTFLHALASTVGKEVLRVQRAGLSQDDQPICSCSAVQFQY